MFIYSVRASTVKIVGLFLLLALLVTGLALSSAENSVSAMSSATEIDYSRIKDKDDRIEFMGNFGITVDKDSEQEDPFRMPENLDRVLLGYNELQRQQGLDLTKYKNKRVTRYSYKVTNYNFDGEVYANLFVHRGKVVACDISSADPMGFVIPMTQVDRKNLK